MAAAEKERCDASHARMRVLCHDVTRRDSDAPRVILRR